MLYRDTVVEEARSQDTGIRSQEFVDCCLKLDLRKQIINWKRVVVGHIDIAARKTGHAATTSGRFGKPTLTSKRSNYLNFCSRSMLLQTELKQIEVIFGFCQCQWRSPRLFVSISVLQIKNIRVDARVRQRNNKGCPTKSGDKLTAHISQFRKAGLAIVISIGLILKQRSTLSAECFITCIMHGDGRTTSNRPA